MIDSEGFRANVGIIIANDAGQLLWARRVGQDAWQFPQGGIKSHESAVDALYRELEEEVGLGGEDVQILGSTQGWLRYRLPKHLIRHHRKPVCVGQKQVWYLLRLAASEERVRFDRCPRPEFDHWRWVHFWEPLQQVVFFKRDVYLRALTELAPILFPFGVPEPPRAPRDSQQRRTRP